MLGRASSRRTLETSEDDEEKEDEKILGRASPESRRALEASEDDEEKEDERMLGRGRSSKPSVDNLSRTGGFSN